MLGRQEGPASSTSGSQAWGAGHVRTPGPSWQAGLWQAGQGPAARVEAHALWLCLFPPGWPSELTQGPSLIWQQTVERAEAGMVLAGQGSETSGPGRLPDTVIAEPDTAGAAA